MTISERYRAILATNSTANSFTTLLNQLAEPAETTAGVIRRGDGPLPKVNDFVIVMPFGAGAANQTFSHRLYGWFPMPLGWVKMLFCEVLCTLCTDPGIAGCTVAASQLYCDTFSLTFGNSLSNVQLLGAANEEAGGYVVDCLGARYVQSKFSVVNATSANGLIGDL